MTQHEEFAIKQRNKDLSTLALAKEQESKKKLVKMTLEGVKGVFMVDEKRVDERKKEGYELA